MRRPAPANNDHYQAQEYQPVIHRLCLLWRPYLRVGLPHDDERCVGNLGHLAIRILTEFSLLIPAFSLLKPPANLTVYLQWLKNAPLPL